MIQIIGEKLNSSIPSTLAMMQAADMNALLALVRNQKDAGAMYLDINTALCGENGVELMRRLVSICRDEQIGVMLDSPDPAVIAQVLPETAGMDVIVNSVTCDERMEELLPLIAEAGCGVVLLPILGGRIPQTAEARVENALAGVKRLTEGGVTPDHIYIDALVESIATTPGAGRVTVDTVKLLREALPDCHIVCGLSNVSFGLPARASLNATALAMMVANGLDAAICDPLSPAIAGALYASYAILGEDDYCIEYIGYIRDNMD